jgi:sugar lactone lactonase YvrE
MKQIFGMIIMVALITTACQNPKQSAEETVATDSVSAAPVTLTLKWETDTLLTTCESVLYDQERDILYAANINGAPDGKDGNGFISKVSLDGKITEGQWVKGLNAPKGMGLFNSKLYVADIDRVIEVDVTNGKITNTFAIEGAKFLNDITVDSAGRVYVSDTGAGNVIVIENGKVTKWLENLAGPNGLLAEGGKVQMVLWDGKTFNTINTTTKEVTVQTDSINNGDGIEAIGDGAYFVSSWDGQVTHIGPDWKKFTILDIRADSVNAADIEYIQEKKLLLVPTFFKNTVRAYEVSK